MSAVGPIVVLSVVFLYSDFKSSSVPFAMFLPYFIVIIIIIIIIIINELLWYFTD